jgi:cation diffusion facilitator family transporter
MSALIMFGVTATLSVYLGYKRLINPEPVESIGLAILVLFISLLTNGYSFSLSFRRLLGKRDFHKFWLVVVHSAFIETKTTLVLDAMGTLASILGLIALGVYALTGQAYLDAIGAISIGLKLYALSLILLVGIKDLVIGKSATEEVEAKIKKSAIVSKLVHNVLDLRTMYIGPDKLLVNMEVNLKNGLTTDDIEDLVDEIKARVKKEVPSVGHIQIELESEEDVVKS